MDSCNDLILCQKEVYLSLLMSVMSMRVKVSLHLTSYCSVSDHLLHIFTKKISWQRWNVPKILCNPVPTYQTQCKKCHVY